MDSIVDSFFPLIGYVEDEADAIDSEIVHHDSLVDLPKAALVAAVPDSPSRRNVFLPQAGALMPSSNAMDDSIELAGERGQRDEVVELERIRKKLGFDSASSSFEEKRREAYEMKEIRLRRSSSKVDVVIETPPLPNSSNPDLTTSFPPPKLHVFFLRVRSRLSYFSLKLFSQLLLFLNLHPVQRARRRRRKQLRFSSSSAGSVASSVSSYSSNGQGSNQDLHDRYRSRSAFDKALMLKRMTATRRLVTGLTRLLLPKSEVVGRLRKRANEVSYGGHWGVVGGDMGTYIGDVQGERRFFLHASPNCLQLAGKEKRDLRLTFTASFLARSLDHILSMQGTLLHYDRILSQAQPAYVSHLRLNLFAAKSGTDKAILGLSIVSIGVIPMQVLCGSSLLSSFFPFPFCRDTVLFFFSFIVISVYLDSPTPIFFRLRPL
jgi:Mg2+ and Co2+ transporter CorA